jgi:hypothetical protein
MIIVYERERVLLADYLPAELILPATSGCSALSAHCATIISSSIITILLYRNIYV